MRILHTSDWHLGRTLHGVDLVEHQSAHLDHLVELTRDEGIDAVLVAGDVYDRAIPPVDAVALLSDALVRLSEHAQVVVTPGNHDSAIRLGFGAELMRPGIHVRTRTDDLDRPVELHGPEESVLVYAVPYLDPDAARTTLQEGEEPLARSHEAVLGAALRRIRADLARRSADHRRGSVVMAHAFVIGGEASESERDIRVGGVDAVPAAVFAGLDYVALGHLHGAQRVACPDGTVGRYSGSPLAYSFSEMNQTKSTALVTIGPDGVLGEVQLVPAPVPRRLSEVTGTLEEILGDAGADRRDDWVRVLVTDPVRPREMNAQVKAVFPHALVIQHRPVEIDRPTLSLTVTPASDPLVVAADFVEHVTGEGPTTPEVDALQRAFEAANAAERSA